MQHVRPFRSILVAAALVTSAVVAAVPQGAVQAVDDPCATTWCGGGEFHPVTPTRILDTRSDLNDVAPLGRKSVGNTAPFFDVDLLGRDPIEGGPLDGYEHQWLPDTVDAGDVLGFIGHQGMPAQARAPVELGEVGATLRVDQAKAVHAKAPHHAQAAGQGVVGHQPHERMGALGHK